MVAATTTDPPLPRPARILRRQRETADTFTLHLETRSWDGRFPFLPGQYNMLYTFGQGEVPISISGDPAHPQTLVHTIRAVGPVTQAMSQLKRGDVVGVRGPLGVPWPVEKAYGHDLLLVAGGLGLAPLRPVILHALANRSRFRRMSILYGARTPEDILYRKELEDWRGRFDVSVRVTVDRASSPWFGHVGVVTALFPTVELDGPNTNAFLCGPEVMMRFSARDLQLRGVPIQRIWVSMERNMKCGVGLCGHCQMGPTLVCQGGPVYRLDRVADTFTIREL